MIIVAWAGPGRLTFTMDGMSKGWSGGSTTAWRTMRDYILKRDRHLCRIGTAGVCTEVATCVDHIVTKELGGGDEETNLRAACEPCNLHRNRERTRLQEEPQPRKVSRW